MLNLLIDPFEGAIMVRFMPLLIMIVGLPLVWFLNPPWKLLIVVGIIAALIACRIFMNPKNYD